LPPRFQWCIMAGARAKERAPRREVSMPIAGGVRKALGASSVIRKMFEEGAALKKEHGADSVFDFSIGNPGIPPPLPFALRWKSWRGIRGKGFTATRRTPAFPR